jgi:quinoprotein glucose dehydrogenase
MRSAFWLSFLSIVFVCCRQNDENKFSTWKFYRGDEGSNAYSSLDQINSENVKELKVAWTYRTGDKSDVFNLECNPIIINNVLYAVSPKLKTFALDAATGKQLWSFDPFNNSATDGGVARGLTYWELHLMQTQESRL